MKKKIEFKLEEDLFNSYKELCEKSGYDMSKRLRLFIESEIPVEFNKIFVNDVKVEPSVDFSFVDIMGVKFMSGNLPPKVFVVSTDDEISKNITFFFNNKKYELTSVVVHKEENGYFLIECKWFSISYGNF